MYEKALKVYPFFIKNKKTFCRTFFNTLFQSFCKNLFQSLFLFYALVHFWWWSSFFFINHLSNSELFIIETYNTKRDLAKHFVKKVFHLKFNETFIRVFPCSLTCCIYSFMVASFDEFLVWSLSSDKLLVGAL